MENKDRKQILIRIDPEVAKNMKRDALERDITVNEWVNQAIQNKLALHESETK